MYTLIYIGVGVVSIGMEELEWKNWNDNVLLPTACKHFRSCHFTFHKIANLTHSGITNCCSCTPPLSVWLDGTFLPPQAQTTDEGQKQGQQGGEDSSSTEVQEEEVSAPPSHSH